ncbi:hypothetical protein D3C71_2155050 [compost metagenome]
MDADTKFGDQRRTDLGIEELALVHRPSDAGDLGGLEHRARSIAVIQRLSDLVEDLVG